MPLIKPVLQFIFSSVAALIAVLCVFIDINILHNGLSEISLTEIVQESILLAIVAIHMWLARSKQELRQCDILIAGFFMSMLIRELDALFDLISHGCWVWFALTVSAIAVISVMRQRANIVMQLTRYTQMISWGIMMSGLLFVLVFSRLFGMSSLWHHILQDGYLRVVKNMVEEGCELFGYVLCLIATLVYASERTGEKLP